MTATSLVLAQPLKQVLARSAVEKSNCETRKLDLASSKVFLIGVVKSN